jgi:hypothetical protein
MKDGGRPSEGGDRPARSVEPHEVTTVAAPWKMTLSAWVRIRTTAVEEVAMKKAFSPVSQRLQG